MIHGWDLVIVLLYLVGTMYVGFYLHRKASQNIDAFFLGDRQLPWWALGASGMASNVDVAGTMVIAALVYVLGVKGFFVEIRGGMVLVLAFFMAFMGKWTRRARVTTSAEWMKLRFGEGREGRVARLMSAVANLVSLIWILSYFIVGGGKFFALFLGVNEHAAGIGLAVLTTLYATASGFYGVVWTDVFQGVIVLCGILYLSTLALSGAPLPAHFPVTVPTGHGTFERVIVSFVDWSRVWPPSHIDLPGQYSIFNLFGVTIFFYFLKTCIEGFGGAGGYMSQRYFAAKSDRDAGLLSLFWIFLLSFRWPLVTAIAVLAIRYSIATSSMVDPELTLPTVIAHYAPVGMRGLLVACFMAAAMSTFVAVINASAAYWVKDIYQTHLNPRADERKLVWQSRAASVIVVALGLLFSFPVVHINDIWGWITMAFGSGLFVPLLLRWYWWRYNGYGFAWGTAAGMVAAVLTHYSGVALPEYMNFVIPGGASLLAAIVGTYLTAPTDEHIVRNFYEVTRPFGFWGPVLRQYSPSEQQLIRADHRQDLFATLFAIPWMMGLSLMGMLVIMRRWDELALVGMGWCVVSVGLYLTWFRRLPSR